MKNKYIKKLSVALLLGCLAVTSMTACGDKKNDSKETVQDNSKDSSKSSDSSDSNSNGDNSQEGAVGVDYISEDGKIKITLPNEEWANIADTDNAKTFQSGVGTINITYASGEGIADLMIPANQDAFILMINGGMADTPFDVISYENGTDGSAKTYKAVIHYTNENNPDKYGIYYGVYEETEGYTAAAILTDDDDALLEEVKSSVFGFQIL